MNTNQQIPDENLEEIEVELIAPSASHLSPPREPL